MEYLSYLLCNLNCSLCHNHKGWVPTYPVYRKLCYDQRIYHINLVKIVEKRKQLNLFGRTWILPENRGFFFLSLIFLCCKQSIHTWKKTYVPKLVQFHHPKCRRKMVYVSIRQSGPMGRFNERKRQIDVLDRDKWSFMWLIFCWSWCLHWWC